METQYPVVHYRRDRLLYDFETDHGIKKIIKSKSKGPRGIPETCLKGKRKN